jgi:hypothetical protein
MTNNSEEGKIVLSQYLLNSDEFNQLSYNKASQE